MHLRATTQAAVDPAVCSVLCRKEYQPACICHLKSSQGYNEHILYIAQCHKWFLFSAPKNGLGTLLWNGDGIKNMKASLTQRLNARTSTSRLLKHAQMSVFCSWQGRYTEVRKTQNYMAHEYGVFRLQFGFTTVMFLKHEFLAKIFSVHWFKIYIFLFLFFLIIKAKFNNETQILLNSSPFH